MSNGKQDSSQNISITYHNVGGYRIAPIPSDRKVFEEIVLTFFKYKSVIFGIILVIFSIGLALQIRYGGNSLSRFGSIMVILTLIVIFINFRVLNFQEKIRKAKEYHSNLNKRAITNSVNQHLIEKNSNSRITEEVAQYIIDMALSDNEKNLEDINLARKNLIVFEFSLGAFGTFVWGYADLFIFCWNNFQSCLQA